MSKALDMNQGERLARIETLMESVMRRLDGMGEDIHAIRDDLEAEKTRNAALRNKGIGLLTGVGMIGTVIGASASHAFEWLGGLVK